MIFIVAAMLKIAPLGGTMPQNIDARNSQDAVGKLLVLLIYLRKNKQRNKQGE